MKQIQSNLIRKKEKQSDVAPLPAVGGPLVNFDIETSLNDPKFFELPPLKHIPILKPNHDNEVAQLPEDIQGTISTLGNYLLQNVNGWDTQIDSSINQGTATHTFNLPPSGFQSEKCVISYISQSFRHEVNQVKPLNAEQLNSIKELGTFQIPSTNFPFPYTWKLSDWVVKGLHRITSSLHFDLALAYHQWFQMKCRIKSIPDVPQGRKIKLRVLPQAKTNTDIYDGLYNLAIAPLNIISALIGFRLLRQMITEDMIHQKLERERQVKLNKIDQIETAIFAYLSVMDENDAIERHQVEKKVEQIEKIFEKFKHLHHRLRQAIQDAFDLQVQKEEQVFQQDDEEDQHKLQVLEQSDRTLLTRFKINLDFEKDVEQQIDEAFRAALKQLIYESELAKPLQKQLIDLIEWHQLYNFTQDKITRQISERRNIVIKEIKEQHKIKSRVDQFFHQEIRRRMQPFEDQITDECNTWLKKVLQDRYPNQAKLYTEFLTAQIEYTANFNSTYNEEMRKNQTPAVQFSVTRQLMPPFEVRKVEQSYGGYDHYYELVRQRKYYLNTDFYGWKFQLFFIRWLVWSFNSFYMLFVSALVGPFGLKALVWLKLFHPDVQCDRKTGVVRPSSYYVNTVFSVFCKVLNGMMNSRDNFESQPDTGFFGKSFARLWNLVEVYVFRLLIGGILITLVLFPLAIVVNVILSVILALTSWAWIPVFLLIRYLIYIKQKRQLICFLIFDFDGIHRRNTQKGSILPNRLFAIPYELFRIAIFGVAQIALALGGLLVIHPAAALAMLLVGYTRYIIRLSYDTVMIRIVSLLGRVPATENKLAWRIGGPGVSRSYYYGISTEDIFVLIYAELERAILATYESQIKEKIVKPQSQAQASINKVFQPFDAHRSYSDPKVPPLNNKLDHQLSKRRMRFPNQPSNNVRFSQAELVFLLRLTKQFIKHQILLKDMCSYVWNHFGVREGDYNQLTRTLWQRSFSNSDVLEPFEDLEMRFMLKSESQSRLNLGQIREALKGSVDLDKQIPTVKAKKVKETPLEIRYFDGQLVLNNLTYTQKVDCDFSSYKQPELAVYLNFQVDQKIRRK